MIEWGAYTSDVAPGTPWANLKKIEWHDTPILEQVIDLTSVPCTHEFGCKVAHVISAGAPTLTASRVLYGAEEASTSVPSSARFALRARLVRFDTENHQFDPRGLLGILGLDRAVVTNSDESSNVGKASIYRI